MNIREIKAEEQSTLQIEVDKSFITQSYGGGVKDAEIGRFKLTAAGDLDITINQIFFSSNLGVDIYKHLKDVKVFVDNAQVGKTTSSLANNKYMFGSYRNCSVSSCLNVVIPKKTSKVFSIKATIIPNNKYNINASVTTFNLKIANMINDIAASDANGLNKMTRTMDNGISADVTVTNDNSLLPDLIITNIDAKEQPGDQYAVVPMVTVKNTGAGYAWPPIYIMYELDGNKYGPYKFWDDSNGSIKPNSEATNMSSFHTSTQSTSIKATINKIGDEYNEIDEADRNNNSYTADIKSSAMPDLTIEKIVFYNNGGSYIERTSAAIGENLCPYAIVKNIGTATTPNVFLVIQDLNQTSNNNSIQPLAPGQSRDVDMFCFTPATAGSYKLNYRVDSGNVIDELNENNNTKEISLTITASANKPDLMVSSLSIKKWETNPSTLVVNYTIKNIGNLAATGPSWMRYYFDTRESEKGGGHWLDPGQNLAVGATKSGEFQIGSTSGITFTLFTLIADSNAYDNFVGTITESDENNNKKTVTLSEAQAAKPDLVIEKLQFSYNSEIKNISTISPGSSVCPYITIKNKGVVVSPKILFKIIGTSPWPSALPLYYYTNDTKTQVTDNENNTVFNHELAPGESENLWVTCFETPKTGTFTIGYTIDAANVVDESNENNNTFNKTITIGSATGINKTDKNKSEAIKQSNQPQDVSPGQKDTAGDQTGKSVDSLILKLQRTISELSQKVIDMEKRLVTKIDNVLSKRVKGRILLQTEANGEAWYVDPNSENKFYMQDGLAAYDIMRALGLGITNKDLETIPIGIQDKIYTLKDTDNDGIPDNLETALGTDPNKADTDGDGYDDKSEILSGYKPTSKEKFSYNQSLINRLKGRIALQVESHGEAWYINPTDGKRYYLGDGNTAYNVMRFLSLGIKNDDLRKIQVGEFSE
ncbi:hypothetical protein COU00_02375 [Candidatus Falkowbacteria bacterium CG10_big_fil_rev_8_21_14_0_10_43_11]|uniref:CARDB domain-containing protein n=1 Tax=Candidatus Falkowbacteria bacterium CG10_big_fil_rev_8_21_14_0_10_43_11 TaxID=1974568 RepID=A0A2M6WM14_9BACT|nr:MAG: hypothetical protein COU00_02375 [Candidatus Falkowbacteria bacterium CG10_big_fil_rev_8_21_14_0_10_43_11]